MTSLPLALLAFLAFPGTKRSPRTHIPILTWIVAIVAAICASYQWWDYAGVAQRTGNPSQFDVIVAIIGIMLLSAAPVTIPLSEWLWLI